MLLSVFVVYLSCRPCHLSFICSLERASYQKGQLPFTLLHSTRVPPPLGSSPADFPMSQLHLECTAFSQHRGHAGFTKLICIHHLGLVYLFIFLPLGWDLWICTLTYLVSFCSVYYNAWRSKCQTESFLSIILIHRPNLMNFCPF